MTLEEWFQKGMNPDEYIESMETHKEDLLHIFDNFSIPEETDFFQQLRAKQLRVLVLTEDWCGDAMMNVPILFHLAQRASMRVSLLPRDQNLELMDQYLTNGKSRSIPVFIFLNRDGEEVAKWGPRAPEVQLFIDESLTNLPDKDAEDFEEKKKELFTFITKSFKDNREFWQDTYEDIKRSLKKV